MNKVIILKHDNEGIGCCPDCYMDNCMLSVNGEESSNLQNLNKCTLVRSELLIYNKMSQEKAEHAKCLFEGTY